MLRAADMPPWPYMEDSRKFVDVRLARWCFERNITLVCPPRPRGWLRKVYFDESIYHTFTRRHPPHVAREIWTYAFEVDGRGEAPIPAAENPV